MTITVARTGTEFQVNSITTSTQEVPRTLGLPGGGFVLVWTDYSGQGGDPSSSIKARIFGADGNPVGPEFLVNSITNGRQENAEIAVLSNGGFAITWQDFSRMGGDASDFSVKVRTFGADGVPTSSEILVNTSTYGDQFFADVTGTSGGGFVVTWTDSSGSGGDSFGYSIKAQQFGADGTKLNGELLINNHVEGYQALPSVVELSDQRLVFSWTDYENANSDDGFNDIKARIFEASGIPSDGEITVNAANIGWHGESVVTALANGGFLVVWNDKSNLYGDASQTSIMARSFDSTGAPTGDPILVNTNTANIQFSPAVTTLPNGSYAIAWFDYSGTLGDTSLSIKAQVFNADGSRLNSEFLVNTILAGDQANPGIATLADGSFIVTWQNGYNGADIKAQIFSVGLNHAPVITSLGGGAVGQVQINENTSAVTTVTADDVDVNSDISFTIAGGADAALFYIDGATGALRFNVAPDFENPMDADNDNLYRVTVGAFDGELTATQEISVSVGDVYDFETFIGTNGNDNYFAASGFPALLIGNGGNDSFGGFSSTVTMDGGAGNDTLWGYVGNDVLIGGEGNDRLLGERGNDTLEGGNGKDSLTGNEGDDKLYGGSGNDMLFGDEGADYLEGGANDDSYIWASAEDQLVEQAGGGIDTVTTYEDWVLTDNFENLVLVGSGTRTGTGNVLANRISSTEEPGTTLIVSGLGGNDILLGASGDDTLDGGRDNDQLFGGAGNDSLLGGDGNDRIDGGIGSDTMDGGAGNDVYYVDNVQDSAGELTGSGTDTVHSTVDFALGTGLENLVFTGNAAATGSGNALNNRLTGNVGDNDLYGMAGKDALLGGNGADRLVGGAGADTLTGGAGNDQFVFDSLTTNADRDVIIDFTSGQDYLVIDRSVFSAFANDPAGILDSSEFFVGSKAITADQHLIYNSTNGGLYYDADGVGGAAQVQIGLLSNHNSIANLTPADIVLI